MNNDYCSAQYWLVAQNPPDKVVIKILAKGHYLIRTADAVIKDEKLMKGLPAYQVEIIKFIAKMETD
jgi:hypothetical protein